MNYSKFCNTYGSVFPGRECCPFYMIFYKVSAHCVKTTRDSLVFSTVPENLCIWHHKKRGILRQSSYELPECAVLGGGQRQSETDTVESATSR